LQIVQTWGSEGPRWQDSGWNLFSATRNLADHLPIMLLPSHSSVSCLLLWNTNGRRGWVWPKVQRDGSGMSIGCSVMKTKRKQGDIQTTYMWQIQLTCCKSEHSCVSNHVNAMCF
jgi:hypothetical protein